MPVLPTGDNARTRADKYPETRTFAKSSLEEMNSNYWLEWVDAGTLKMAILPFPSQPTNFTVQTAFPTSIEYTLGLRPKREHNYVKQWMITVSGRIGVADRYYTHSEFVIPPIDILTYFKRFLEDYQQGATENGAVWLIDNGKGSTSREDTYHNYNKTTLVLRATKEAEHFYVEPVSFTYDRNAANTRQSASWTLVLRAWERDDEQRPPLGYMGFPHHKSGPTAEHTAFVKALDHITPKEAVGLLRRREEGQSKVMLDAATKLKSEDRASLIQWIDTGAKKTAAGTGQAVQACLSITKLVNWAAMGGSKLKQAQLASLAFVQQAENFRTSVRQVTDILKVPLLVIGNLMAGADKYAATLQDVVDTTASTYSSYKSLVLLLTSARYAQSDAAHMLGQAGGHPGDYSSATLPLMSSGVTGVYTSGSQMAGQPWAVPAGVSSWEQLSSALYGSPSYGKSLAKLNNAKDGVSDSKGKPLAAGDVVMIPAGAIRGTADPDSIMGVDFAIDPAVGDLQWDQPGYLSGTGVDLTMSATAGTDLALSRGIPNLVQAIRYRSITRRGVVPSLPGYGLLLVGPGEGMSEMAVSATFANMRPQMLQDVRIVDVTDQQVVGDVDNLAISFRVYPTGPAGEGIHVVAPLAGA